MPSRGLERGSVNVELAVLAPILLTVLFLAIQSSYFFYARQVAIASAQEGVRTMAAYDSDLATGVAVAEATASEWGGIALTNLHVVGERTATRASITVNGTAVHLLPGPPWEIQQTATLPVERP